MIFCTGSALLNINPHQQQRKQFDALMTYFQSKGAENQYVCALYGLPGTGKTTILEQAINALLSQGIPPDSIGYITGEAADDFDTLCRELGNNKHHVRYIFIDETGRFCNFLLDGCFLYDTLVRIYNCKVVIADATPLAIYVAMKRTLYDRCRVLHVPHLNFEEHCKFVVPTNASSEADRKEYLQHGGLFEAPRDVSKYIRMSLADPILALLETQPKREVLAWLEPDMEYVDWNRLVNTILALSVRNHLPNGSKVTGVLSNEQLAREFQQYFNFPKQERHYRMKRTQTVALLDYLIHCGVLEYATTESSQCDIQMPLLRYHSEKGLFASEIL